jgi:hypothetical protein
VQAGAANPDAAAGAGLPAATATARADSSKHTAAVAAPDSLHHSSAAVSDSARSAVRADSLHRSALGSRHVVATPGVTPATPPVEHHPISIVSWGEDSGPKLTKAQRDSAHRAQKARSVAKRDSLKREEATRDSLKHAAKAAKAAKPAAATAPADSARGQNP